eukprot:TRINITY_DN9229_c0_g1_i4.p1 TRINITY_DN9229_c0_g1~~TRINITY_DN9229_c0_g1_i4.p1  ORF type:complete len:1487 (+),score=84.01 TRINITY_DN9229_c0_g1_i4:75-4463(+)
MPRDGDERKQEIRDELRLAFPDAAEQLNEVLDADDLLDEATKRFGPPQCAHMNLKELAAKIEAMRSRDPQNPPGRGTTSASPPHAQPAGLEAAPAGAPAAAAVCPTAPINVTDLSARNDGFVPDSDATRRWRAGGYTDGQPGPAVSCSEYKPCTDLSAQEAFVSDPVATEAWLEGAYSDLVWRGMERAEPGETSCVVSAPPYDSEVGSGGGGCGGGVRVAKSEDLSCDFPSWEFLSGLLPHVELRDRAVVTGDPVDNGRGGSGDVSRTDWTPCDPCDPCATRSPNAVKVINLKRVFVAASHGLQKNDRGIAHVRRQYREIQALQKLHGHPGVITLLDKYKFKTADGILQLHLIMPLARSNLTEFFVEVHSKKLRSDEERERALELARKLGNQLCSALWYLHRLQIVNRDVKPDNILMMTWPERASDCPADCLQITDFGLAALDAQRTDVGCAGTANWQAPECRGKSGQLTAEADAFSCGCVLIQLYTGMAPFVFGADEPEKCLAAKQAEQYYGRDILKDRATEAEFEYITGLLRANPEERESVRLPESQRGLLHPTQTEHQLPQLYIKFHDSAWTKKNMKVLKAPERKHTVWECEGVRGYLSPPSDITLELSELISRPTAVAAGQLKMAWVAPPLSGDVFPLGGWLLVSDCEVTATYIVEEFLELLQGECPAHEDGVNLEFQSSVCAWDYMSYLVGDHCTEEVKNYANDGIGPVRNLSDKAAQVFFPDPLPCRKFCCWVAAGTSAEAAATGLRPLCAGSCGALVIGGWGSPAPFASPVGITMYRLQETRADVVKPALGPSDQWREQFPCVQEVMAWAREQYTSLLRRPDYYSNRSIRQCYRALRSRLVSCSASCRVPIVHRLLSELYAGPAAVEFLAVGTMNEIARRINANCTLETVLEAISTGTPQRIGEKLGDMGGISTGTPQRIGEKLGDAVLQCLTSDLMGSERFADTPMKCYGAMLERVKRRLEHGCSPPPESHIEASKRDPELKKLLGAVEALGSLSMPTRYADELTATVDVIRSVQERVEPDSTLYGVQGVEKLMRYVKVRSAHYARELQNAELLECLKQWPGMEVRGPVDIIGGMSAALRLLGMGCYDQHIEIATSQTPCSKRLRSCGVSFCIAMHWLETVCKGDSGKLLCCGRTDGCSDSETECVLLTFIPEFLCILRFLPADTAADRDRLVRFLCEHMRCHFALRHSDDWDKCLEWAALEQVVSLDTNKAGSDALKWLAQREVVPRARNMLENWPAHAAAADEDAAEVLGGGEEVRSATRNRRLELCAHMVSVIHVILRTQPATCGAQCAAGIGAPAGCGLDTWASLSIQAGRPELGTWEHYGRMMRFLSTGVVHLVVAYLLGTVVGDLRVAENGALHQHGPGTPLQPIADSPMPPPIMKHAYSNDDVRGRLLLYETEVAKVLSKNAGALLCAVEAFGDALGNDDDARRSVRNRIDKVVSFGTQKPDKPLAL